MLVPKTIEIVWVTASYNFFYLVNSRTPLFFDKIKWSIKIGVKWVIWILIAARSWQWAVVARNILVTRNILIQKRKILWILWHDLTLRTSVNSRFVQAFIHASNKREFMQWCGGVVVIRSPHDPEVPSSNPGKNNTSDFSIRDPLSLPSCDWYRIYLAMWWNSSVGRAADLIYTCQVRCHGFDSRCFPHI